jgi:hypothetical protein
MKPDSAISRLFKRHAGAVQKNSERPRCTSFVGACALILMHGRRISS